MKETLDTHQLAKTLLMLTRTSVLRIIVHCTFVLYNTKAYKKSVSPINIGRWYCDSPIGIIEDLSGSEQADFFVQMKKRYAAVASPFWGSVDDCAWHFEGYPKEDTGNPQDASFKKSYLLGVVRPHQIAPALYYIL